MAYDSETQSISLSSTGDVYTRGTYKDNEGRKFRSIPPADDTRTSTGYKDMTNLEEDEDPQWYVAPRGNQDWPCHVIDMPTKAKDVSAGAAFNVALLVNGSIVTWGLGDCGELARPVPKMNKKTSNDIIVREFLTPRPPVWDGPTTIGSKRSVTISAGGYHLLVVSLLITHISTYLQVGTYPVRTSRYLPLAKTSTYLVTTKLGRTQQYTLLIAITLVMSSAS